MKNTDYSLEEIILLKEENEKLKTQVSHLELMLQNRNERGAGRKNISTDIQNEIWKKSQEGIKVSKLSDEYGLSPATIYSILRKHNVEKPKIEEPTEIKLLDDTSLKTDGDNIFDYLNEGFFS